MDPTLKLKINRSSEAFEPGDTLDGIATWNNAHGVNSAELHLFWTTSGKGTKDTEIIATIAFDAPLTDDSRPFSIILPSFPHSFSGTLISLIWGVELVLNPGNQSTNNTFVLAPGGKEIRLQKVL